MTGMLRERFNVFMNQLARLNVNNTFHVFV